MTNKTTNEPRVCQLGEPMMHGPQPYRWCKVHDDLMQVCDRRFGGRFEPSPRICQRGVDGSLSCGHSDGVDKDGRCQGRSQRCFRSDEVWYGPCKHVCDLSPSPLEAKEVHEALRQIAALVDVDTISTNAHDWASLLIDIREICVLVYILLNSIFLINLEFNLFEKKIMSKDTEKPTTNEPRDRRRIDQRS